MLVFENWVTLTLSSLDSARGVPGLSNHCPSEVQLPGSSLYEGPPLITLHYITCLPCGQLTCVSPALISCTILLF